MGKGSPSAVVGAGKGEIVELYVHIPFCVKKCDYCDFLSGPASREAQEAYVQALVREISLAGAAVREPITTVFIGGGTPSLLRPEQMGRILEQMGASFSLVEEGEVTLEANPGTLTKEKLALYRRLGVNRLSLGLQSPEEEELRLLGRIHTFRQFLDSFWMAREAGFSNINVDLMGALPRQSREGWRKNLRTVARLAPEHISAYSLMVEEGTPFYERELELPDEDTEYGMYEDTAEVLGEYGYRQYEISNYALPGRECEHNIGYWRRTPYLGLGLGAASLVGNLRFSNTRDQGEYLRKSREEGFPESIRQERTLLSPSDQMAEYAFLGLRMTEGISLEGFRREFSRDFMDIYGPVVKKYSEMGLLLREGDRLFLSREGIHVSNQIMADFL
ncbi:MAG: radical SAM family heme chaperone HemW [Eubacteriales bacterium]|nr:radical SAM family heme chaperone HemW [Eubacteriales bacterium]